MLGCLRLSKNTVAFYDGQASPVLAQAGPKVAMPWAKPWVMATLDPAWASVRQNNIGPT